MVAASVTGSSRDGILRRAMMVNKMNPGGPYIPLDDGLALY
jgi:hypothetical protein